MGFNVLELIQESCHVDWESLIESVLKIQLKFTSEFLFVVLCMTI